MVDYRIHWNGNASVYHSDLIASARWHTDLMLQGKKSR